MLEASGIEYVYTVYPFFFLCKAEVCQSCENIKSKPRSHVVKYAGMI